MGHLRHHAIVVTSWSPDTVHRARSFALTIGLRVSDVVMHATNGGASFLVAPDGSYEGYPEANRHDRLRANFRKWLDGQRYDDGSSDLSWVEVSCSPDDRESKINRDAWATWAPFG